MRFVEQFLRVLFLDFAKYPNINLRNDVTLNQQFENIKKFKLKRICLYGSVVITCFEIFLFLIFTKAFDLGIKKEILVNVHLVCIPIMGILIVIFMLTFRCPNCGTMPKGRSFSLGAEVSYAKGLHPFPKRCECCGFYLSKKVLLRDIAKLHNKPDADKQEKKSSIDL